MHPTLTPEPPPYRSCLLAVRFQWSTGTLRFRTLHLDRLSNCYLSTPPIQPYLQFNYTPSAHQSHTAISACSLSPFCGFCCLWEPLFFIVPVSYAISSRFIHFACPHLSALLPLLFTFPSARHTRRSCVFGCVLNTFGWRPLNAPLDSSMY